MNNQDNKRPSILQKLKYWMNHHLVNTTMNMFITLAIITVIVVVILSAILFFFDESELFPAVWDTLATTINAWMPASEDGSVLYLITLAIAAVVGILFTSFLIGILTTAIEEKLESIRNGNTRIVEENHIVVMGLHTGLYRLLKELILTAHDKKMTIVVVGSEERTTQVERIKENLDIPKNIRIRYRSIDVCDPTQMACLSLPTASKIIMNNGDDNISLKCILAISSITKQYVKRPDIVAIIHSESNLRAFKEAGDGHVMLTLQSHFLISKLIAHTCVKPGLASVFEEIFGFDGLDFYFEKISACTDKTFQEITDQMENGIPVGLFRAKHVMLNPDSDTICTDEDEIIYLADEQNSYQIRSSNKVGINTEMHERLKIHHDVKQVCLIGIDRKIPEIRKELSLLNCETDCIEEIDTRSENDLLHICKKYDNLIILGGTDDNQLNDNEIIRLLLRLRGIRKDFNLHFNMTVQMSDEKNKMLIDHHDLDFIIASDISNMVMAQLVDSPRRLPVFKELLSKTGCEITTIHLSTYIENTIEIKVEELRRFSISHGFILIGYRNNKGTNVMLKRCEETIMLTPKDDLIVIANDEEIYDEYK